MFFKVDCVAFGHLATGFLRETTLKESEEVKQFFVEKCGNLLAFMKRMIKKYYPDWKTIAPKGINVD